MSCDIYPLKRSHEDPDTYSPEPSRIPVARSAGAPRTPSVGSPLPPPPDALSHPSPPPTTYRTPSSPLPFAPRLFAPPPPPFPMLRLIFSTYTNRVCFLSPPCPPMTPQTPPAPPSIPNPHGCNARNTLTSPRRLSRWSRSFLSWGVINLQPD